MQENLDNLLKTHASIGLRHERIRFRILSIMISNKFAKYSLISVCLLMTCGNILSYYGYSEVYTVDIYSRLFPLLFIFEIIILGTFGWYIFHLKKYSLNGNIPISLWISVFFALLARLMILYLPYISGIRWSGGDQNTHGAIIYDIVNNGIFYSGNDYPFAHIIAAGTHLLTGSHISIAMYYLIGAFVIVFTGGIYLLAKNLVKYSNKRSGNTGMNGELKLIPPMVLLISLIGMMISINAIDYTPHSVSNLLYPIIFGICLTYARTHYHGYVVLATIILIPFAFYHPAGALFLCMSYMGYLVVASGFIFIDTRKITVCRAFLKKNSLIVLLFAGMIAIFLFWSIILHSRFDNNINQMFLQIMGSMDVSGQFDVISTKLEKAGVTNIAEIILLGGKMYGFKVVILFISFLSFTFLYLSRKKSSLWTPMLGGIFGISGAYVFFYGGSLIGLAGSKGMALGRVEYILLTFSPIYIGFILYFLMTYKSHTFWGKGLVVMICILLSTFGLVSCFTAYPSPFIEQGTGCQSALDTLIYHWSFVYGPTDVSYINQPLTSVYRIAPLAYLYYNDITTPSIIDISDGLKYTTTLSDHFGYNKSAKYLSTLIGNDVFIPIREYDRIIYDKIYTKLNRLNSQDFSQLEMDWSVNKVYTNKGYSDMYLTM